VLLTLAAFIAVIGVLIFVHEAGHFIAAKAVGVQVLRFSLGFGKPLVLFRRGETEYVIATIPLGGYVKMAGLEDEGLQGELEGGAADVPVDPARAFDKKPLWARMIVILAGVTMNIILAVAIFTGLTAVRGESHTAATTVDSVYADSLPPATAGALAELRHGDSIVSVNGTPVKYLEQITDAFLFGRYPVRLGISGRVNQVVISGDGLSEEDRARLSQSILTIVPPIIDEVTAGSAAKRAGFVSKDRVVAVGSDSVDSWWRFTAIVRGHPHDSLHVSVLRGGTRVSLVLIPERRSVTDPLTLKEGMGGYAGVSPLKPEVLERVSFGRAAQVGITRSKGAVLSLVRYIGGLTVGRGSVRDLGGPIAIADVSGQAARLGIDAVLVVIAVLSVNLAVLNLLPIPVLDGGQMVFLIAEGLRRRPLSLRLRLALTQVGFVFIVLLMVFVLGNDVLRYVFHR
jgi:regulator of sigma E protease